MVLSVKSEVLRPSLDVEFLRVQVVDDDECIVLDPHGSSFLITYRELENLCKKRGFADPTQVVSYLWNFRAIRVDFKRHQFGAVPFLDQM